MADTQPDYSFLDASRLNDREFAALTETFRSKRLSPDTESTLSNTAQAKESMTSRIAEYQADEAKNRARISELEGQLAASKAVTNA